jgi:hypothetical protein
VSSLEKMASLRGNTRWQFSRSADDAVVEVREHGAYGSSFDDEVLGRIPQGASTGEVEGCQKGVALRRRDYVARALRLFGRRRGSERRAGGALRGKLGFEVVVGPAAGRPRAAALAAMRAFSEPMPA